VGTGVVCAGKETAKDAANAANHLNPGIWVHLSSRIQSGHDSNSHIDSQFHGRMNSLRLLDHGRLMTVE
jgi:hypothetical protein